MELNKCTRCGAFHTNSGDVCPKCANRDNLELSTFRKNVYCEINESLLKLNTKRKGSYMTLCVLEKFSPQERFCDNI